jgi:hypothetical protein
MGDDDAFARNAVSVYASGVSAAAGTLHDSEQSGKPAATRAAKGFQPAETGRKFDGSEPRVFRPYDERIWVVIQHQILADRLRK